jgi:prevent-host-death family protein
MRKITATEFAKNFGQFRESVQREPLAVTSHGRTTGYFVSANDYREYQKLKAMARQSIRVVDLSEAEIEEIAAVRMDKKFNHLNKLLND